MKNIIILILIVNSIQVSGQIKVWMRFGDKAFEKKDYYSSSKFYLKAWDVDSTFDGLIYKLGLAFKGYHNNEKAISYFKKIESSNVLRINHPDYLFHIAEIHKLLGEYKLSKTYFEKFLRIRNSDSFQYSKSKQEIKVHDDILQILEDSSKLIIRNLGDEINTGVAEYYSVWLSDSSILYSSLKASDITEEGVVRDDSYVIRIYTGYKKDSIWYGGNVVTTGDDLNDFSFTDGSFDESGNFYFAKQIESSKYNLVKTRLVLDEIVKTVDETTFLLKMDSIKPVFRRDEFNYRNPFVFKSQGKRYMLFSSDRSGGRGNMDLWYSENKNGSWKEPRNLGVKINSLGDEIGPFYDTTTERLYFSSNWHYGLGGFDLFEAKGSWRRPTSIENMGIPMNSSSNDLYISPLDSLNGLFTSSREGANTNNDAVCCNDLYSYKLVLPKVDSTLNKITEVLSRDSIMDRLQSLVRDFHVTLYFHNDCPNPDNRDTITPYSYLETYDAYLDSMPTYYYKNTLGTSGKDSVLAFNRINDFFDDYVHKGVEDLRIFSNELLKELEMGNKILLTVKGYASPLAKSDYNVNLTLRRINSLQNYLRNYPDNAFEKYLDETALNGGVLRIKKIPFGEFKSDSTVSDNYFDTKKSIYSKYASLERKVEIINLTLLDTNTYNEPILFIDLDSSKTIFHLGVLDISVFAWFFKLNNNNNQSIKIIDIDAGCTCLKPQTNMIDILPNESFELEVNVDLSKYEGKLGRKIDLVLENGTKKSIIIFLELPKK